MHEMSPAPIEPQPQLDLQLQALARAFEALLLTTQQLSCKEKTLQQRLKYASVEVNSPTALSTSALHPFCLKGREKSISSRSGVASAAVTDISCII